MGGRGRWVSEFEASLVYRVSSRTARATQRNPVSKKPKPKQNKTKRNLIHLVLRLLGEIIIENAVSATHSTDLES